MKNKFGNLLRDNRRRANKTLLDIATLLGVKLVYISEVERGTRPPLSGLRIRTVAAYLGVDPDEMLQAAVRERGIFELDVTNASPSELAALSGMARGGLSDDQWDEIARITNGNRKHE